ncbi:MAG: efflux RND transporter permease subunit [Gammaproteobacteria bacterium]|nr:efflux RND transporter permease subunit [Gammaproteobacteria bacterium]MBT8054738.1 efflux RND transporter permease subunit [Gammaproteobacteria bacterium]
MNSRPLKLVEIATRRRVAISMGAVTLVLFGLISLQGLKVNLLPDLSYPTLTVRTEYRGAAPEEVETLLTRPVEEAVGVVKNVRSVKSVSRAGQSDVMLEFTWGTDMDLAGLDVREKLEVLRLPLESSRPLLLRFNPATDPIMRLGLIHGESAERADETSLKVLRRHADEEIKKILEPVDGVAAVKVSGGLEDEIQIEIDQDRMAQLKISLESLSSRLAAENVNVSAGRLEQGTQRYLVRTINQFASVEEFGNLIVSTAEARPVYLRDIARVRSGYSEREAIIRMNGREAVEISVYKEGDANTVSVAAAVKSRLQELADDLPQGVELETVDDQSVFIDRAIKEVINAAILGGLLAILVIFLFLRNAWFTLTIALCIPVSIIATFFLMGQAGISLNIMSLGGIALATGLLVDNGIVVLENISRYRSAGEGLVSAAIKGASEVGGAVIASTLTTIAVFLPLAFVDGVAGQLFRDQALTVAFALVVSLLVAITLIPMMASTRGHKTLPREPGSSRMGSWFASSYARLLDAALRHRAVTMAVAALALACSAVLLSTIGTELLPRMQQGRFDVTLEAAPGTPLEATDRIAGRVQRAATADAGVKYVYGVAGSGNRIDANPTESGENIARMMVAMKSTASREQQESVIEKLRFGTREIAGLESNFSEPELLNFDKPLEIEIQGYDLDSLRKASEQVLKILRASDRFADVESSLERGHPEIQIFFDQERAAALGLTVKQISDQVVGKIRGQVATRYSWRDRKIDVLVRLSEQDRQSISDVRELIVNPQSDRPVPLSSVAEIRIAEGPAEIRRADQERMALLRANLAYGDLGSAVAEAEKLLSDVQLPYGLSMRITGQSEEMEASFRSLIFALGLAVFLVYLVMASQFESLLHPFVIIFSIPLAAAGVALALWLTDTRLSVIVFIGLIMLAGIVVNNAIVLVDLINKLRERGMERISAVREAARLRLRPIMMTTLTTVLGLLPMALGLGEGAEMRTPMAVTVIGGLLTSTLLTLVVVPVMYSLLDRRKDAVLASPGQPGDDSGRQIRSSLTVPAG